MNNNFMETERESLVKVNEFSAKTGFMNPVFVA